MSASGRNHADRVEADFYATECWATRILFPYLRRPSTVLEPAAGEGDMLIELAHWAPDAQLFGLELDSGRAATANQRLASFRNPSLMGPGRPHVVTTDSLAFDWPRDVDLMMTNPPFSLAHEFVERAVTTLSPTTEKAFLLRLGFLETPERTAFHRQYPSDLFVLPKRPSFVWAYMCHRDDGGCESAWTAKPDKGNVCRVCGVKSRIAKNGTCTCATNKGGCGNVWTPTPSADAFCRACGKKARITKNDMAAYGWYVWGEGHGGKDHGRIFYPEYHPSLEIPIALPALSSPPSNDDFDPLRDTG